MTVFLDAFWPIFYELTWPNSGQKHSVHRLCTFRNRARTHCIKSIGLNYVTWSSIGLSHHLFIDSIISHHFYTEFHIKSSYPYKTYKNQLLTMQNSSVFDKEQLFFTIFGKQFFREFQLFKGLFPKKVPPNSTSKNVISVISPKNPFFKTPKNWPLERVTSDHPPLERVTSDHPKNQ